MTVPRRVATFVLAVGRRFQADEGLSRAAALAYTSLLSLVPLLAVMFAVLKGLGTQRRLEPLLLSRLSLAPETTTAIVEYIDRTNVRTLGALGAAALLVTVVSVLGTIESAFNHVWRVREGRRLWRKLTDYLSVVLLTPFLLLAAVALTSSLQVQQVIDWLRQSDHLIPVAVFGVSLVPVAMNVAAIALLYSVMPNRRPAAGPVLLGAAAAGTAWHLVQLAYVRFQIGMANYNAIYGALSQVPVTMVWLYVSWAVVLLGAEIAAVAEFGTGGVGAAARPPAHVTGVALQVLVRAARAFGVGGGAVDARRLARELGLDTSAVTTVADTLVERGWLVPVAGPGSRYVLARPPGQIVLADLAESLPPLDVGLPYDAAVTEVLRAAEAGARAAWASRTLADLLPADHA